MIEIKNVHKTINGKRILKGIDLTIQSGEVIVIIGPSGSGKTTFLRCLNFLEKANEGSISFAGAEYSFNQMTSKEILALRRRTGMVFQQYDLFANKTVVQNITEGLITARGIPKQQANDQAGKLLKKVGLASKAAAYPHQLSGGQQQRVGIARALALQPEIILFDEPTSALDPELVAETLTVIKQVANEGGTLLIVTHEMQFAYEVADRVLFMENGIILEQGTAKDMFEKPKMERTRAFLANAQFSVNKGLENSVLD